MNRDQRKFFGWPLALVLLIGAPLAQAQWLTQSFTLTNGWNAVFTHVDASHLTLDDLVATNASNPILEIWRWSPASGQQFYDSAQVPLDNGSQFVSWNRNSANNSLQRLGPNSAYLVRVATNVASYTWTLKGKPVAPINDWTTTGLNFIGFPTVTNNPPKFDAFLARSVELLTNVEVFYYRGDGVELGTSNPAKLDPSLFRAFPVTRGQAFWVRSGNLFNHYFGPFELNLQSGSLVDFGDRLSSTTIRLKNLTTNSLTVTLRLLASESPPPGQSNIDGTPPLLLRGSLNVTNLTYSYTNLPINSSRSWALGPKGQTNSELEVVLGLNRSAITNPPGSLLAGILRFTDSLGFSQVDAPVSARAGSDAGLWVGQALVTQVGQYLKSYDRNGDGSLVLAGNGQYVVTNVDTTLAAVAKPFPLRLIVHNPSNSANAKLLQRAFYGLDVNTNLIVANQESALNRNLLAQARRITATHLPWSPGNAPWSFSGPLSAASLTTTILVGHNDQANNPFLHTYHPDHDNLDALFKTVLPAGQESYTIQRDITLKPSPPADDFGSLVTRSQTLGGEYLETITVAGAANQTRVFQMRGGFSLRRLSDVPSLTVVP